MLHDLANVYPASRDGEAQVLGVPSIDALLEVFMLRVSGPADAQHQHPPERNPDDEEMLFQDDDNGAPESLSNIFFSGFAQRNKRPIPVLEISSSLSGAGKSQLLYYLVARAVIPRSYNGVHIGGQEAAVVFMDADDRFDADRLRVVTRSLLQQSVSQAEQKTDSGDPASLSTEGIESVLLSSLQHVHIFRPQSSSALLATLSKLDGYLYDVSQHHSSSRPLQMLVIDSATAFIWQDRLRDEVARTEEIGRPREEVDRERELKQSFYLSDLYAEIIKQLKRLQGRFGCTVVYTTVSGGRTPVPNAGDHSGPFGQYDRTTSRIPSLRPPLPAPWGTFPTLRLIVHRDAVRSFPPGMSAHSATKKAAMRQSVVQQGKFSGWVNGWDREEWPRRVTDGVDAHNGGSFSFYIKDAGVEIPLPGQ